MIKKKTVKQTRKREEKRRQEKSRRRRTGGRRRLPIYTLNWFMRSRKSPQSHEMLKTDDNSVHRKSHVFTPVPHVLHTHTHTHV